MNVFEVVKENVTARQAAEAYGLKVGRTGMACCPFHSDILRDRGDRWCMVVVSSCREMLG